MNNSIKYLSAILVVGLISFGASFLIMSELEDNQEQGEQQEQSEISNSNNSSVNVEDGNITDAQNSEGNESTNNQYSATETVPANTYTIRFVEAIPGQFDPYAVEFVESVREYPDEISLWYYTRKLLDGPTKAERDGLNAIAPSFDFFNKPDTRFNLEIKDNTLAIKFLDGFYASNDVGSLEKQYLKENLTKEFNFDKVIILDEFGRCFTDMSGLEICMRDVEYFDLMDRISYISTNVNGDGSRPAYSFEKEAVVYESDWINGDFLSGEMAYITKYLSCTPLDSLSGYAYFEGASSNESSTIEFINSNGYSECNSSEYALAKYTYYEDKDGNGIVVSKTSDTTVDNPFSVFFWTI